MSIEISCTITNESDTETFAQQLATLNIIGTVWLSGDLGAGKTTLTRYWLRALGHLGNVKSPTYTLVEPYTITKNNTTHSVYHADLYRLQDPEELEYIGFDEYIEEEGSLVIIEWASRADDYLPKPVLTIAISKITDELRSICLHGDVFTDTNVLQAFKTTLTVNNLLYTLNDTLKKNN